MDEPTDADDFPYSPARTAVQERDYFLMRAASHKQLAENAADITSAETHRTLSRLYGERAARIVIVQPD